MADEFIYPDLDEGTEIWDGDFIPYDHDPLNAVETLRIKESNLVAEFFKRSVYQVVRTAPSNNLLVEIKNADGSNASTNRPLTFPIAGSQRKLSTSLSVQVNSGVNTFNFGAVEFANTDQDLFVYIGWRASNSSVFVLLSRIPYAEFYADFSSTATNEKYGAYSGSAPAASDRVVIIGRVNVQNSGTASYNWSLPAADAVINRPIYKTRALSYNPQWASSGTAPAIVNGTLAGQYQIDYISCKVRVRQVNGSSTTYGTGTYTWSLPFTAATFTNGSYTGAGRVFDSSTTTFYIGTSNVASAATTMSLFTHAATTAVSGTVPVTLATSDQIVMQNEYVLGL